MELSGELIDIDGIKCIAESRPVLYVSEKITDDGLTTVDSVEVLRFDFDFYPLTVSVDMKIGDANIGERMRQLGDAW